MPFLGMSEDMAEIFRRYFASEQAEIDRFRFIADWIYRNPIGADSSGLLDAEDFRVDMDAVSKP